MVTKRIIELIKGQSLRKIVVKEGVHLQIANTIHKNIEKMKGKEERDIQGAEAKVQDIPEMTGEILIEEETRLTHEKEDQEKMK